MSIHPLAGQPAPQSSLINIPRLVARYYTDHPDSAESTQRIAFGTSGHRGSSLTASFNEDHIAAITQAICDYRQTQGYSGPLFLGMDTHALSEPAQNTALEVLAANGVIVMLQAQGGYTPTPVISHAILGYNRSRTADLADGVVITPSHNPPGDGGFKYNPPSGGPADTTITKIIETQANRYLEVGLRGVRRWPLQRAERADTTQAYDYVTPYVADLGQVIRMDAIARAGLRIGVDPLGGASAAYWAPIRERYGLDITVVNARIDPTFSFMTLDHDGKIRMDCSSPYAMAGLIRLKDQFDIAFGNDPDSDRHGIVTPGGGLMNPNHYLATAIGYLFQNRPNWPANVAVGKTLVSSSMIDRVAERLGRRLAEVPVGFKWFVNGLLSGSLGFGGEESAGASFLRLDGRVWTTDKDGIILDLLAAEILAVTGRDPAEHYHHWEEQLGSSVYERIDAPATPDEKSRLGQLSAERVHATQLAGEPIRAILTQAPANGAAIGGLKVASDNGWFAARPSGTENIYKIYAESFLGSEHLAAIQAEAQAIVSQALG